MLTKKKTIIYSGSKPYLKDIQVYFKQYQTCVLHSSKTGNKINTEIN